MSESVLDPCVWPIDVDVCCSGLPSDTPQAVIDRAIVQASGIMRSLSGLTVGTCQETIRPLHMCQDCRSSCCGGADGIALFGSLGEPVSEVLQVRIGAEIVDPSTYWFEDGMLWRYPPERWPSKDPKWQPCGEGEAFCVEALIGTEPDAWALSVAGELVCELAKACLGKKCRIPQNATSVNAQGVTVTLDPDTAMTLIPSVAGWVRATNPSRALVPSVVWSPDTRGGSLKRERSGRRWPW